MTNDKTLKDEIEYKITHLSKLATLPSVAQSIIELVNRPTTSASDLEKVISTDQVLTTRILKTANSAFYGFQKEVSTLKLAVVILGFEAIRGLALSCSIIENLKIDNEHRFDMQRFWEHSISTAIISQTIAKKIGHRVSGEAFVAGLLHDIGLLILVEEFPELFDLLEKEIDQSGSEILKAEQNIFDCTHHNFSYWLLNKWNFPETLKDAILHQEDYFVLNNFQLAKTLEISNLLSCFVGKSGPMDNENVDEKLKNILTPKEYDLFIPMAEKSIENSASLFNNLIPN